MTTRKIDTTPLRELQAKRRSLRFEFGAGAEYEPGDGVLACAHCGTLAPPIFMESDGDGGCFQACHDCGRLLFVYRRRPR